MDALTLFGVVAVSAMMIFYALEERATYFVLAFAGACVVASVYGFLKDSPACFGGHFSENRRRSSLPFSAAAALRSSRTTRLIA